MNVLNLSTPIFTDPVLLAERVGERRAERERERESSRSTFFFFFFFALAFLNISIELCSSQVFMEEVELSLLEGKVHQAAAEKRTQADKDFCIFLS